MIRALLVGLIGAAAIVGVYLFVPRSETPVSEPEMAVAPQMAPTQTLSASERLAAATPAVSFELRPGAEAAGPENGAPPQLVRDVTPDNMTAGPRITGALVRVDPPAAASEARSERLFNPLVVSAGAIKARGREIHLAGIEAPEFEKSCGEGAAAWPCGRMARAALRSFIRGRAIECEIPAGAGEIPDPAMCVVAGDNISEWLVAQGWAKRSGAAFETAEQAARDAKLGLWGDARPGGQPAEVATSG